MRSPGRSEPHGPTSPATTLPQSPGGQECLLDLLPTGPTPYDELGTERGPARRLFSLLGWQWERRAWRVRCRDEFGRYRVLRVRINGDGVRIDCSRPGSVVLRPLEVGRLRGVLRQAVVAHAMYTNGSGGRDD